MLQLPMLHIQNLFSAVITGLRESNRHNMLVFSHMNRFFLSFSELYIAAIEKGSFVGYMILFMAAIMISTLPGSCP